MLSDKTQYDALIVGAGPAGTSAAIRLAQSGRRVLLVEAKRFPRHKLCGEFISPECFGHFRQLGVSDEMLACGGTPIGETRFYSASGRSVGVPSEWFGGASSGALGLSRARMDTVMLRAAREAGAEVREETRARALAFDVDNVCGVHVVDADGRESEVCASVVLDATGRGRVLARMAERGRRKADDSATDDARPRAALVAFKAHLENVRGIGEETSSARERSGSCEIYFYRGGYGGLNGVEDGRANVCFIVRADDVRRCGSDAERVLREVVFGNARARRALANARAVTAWLCVALEGFGSHTLTPAPNLLAVGDAAAFIDPFTGSGMLMALESGAVAAEAITAASLPSGCNSHTDLAADYAARYAARFDQRLRVCARLRRAAFAPPLAVEWAIALFNLNAGVRRRFARATRSLR